MLIVLPKLGVVLIAKSLHTIDDAKGDVDVNLRSKQLLMVVE